MSVVQALSQEIAQRSVFEAPDTLDDLVAGQGREQALGLETFAA